MLPLLFLSFTSPSLAADLPDLPSDSAVEKDKSKNKGEKKGKGNDSDGDGKKKKKKDDEGFLGMEWEPYVEPGGGVQIDSSGEMAVTAGADVGVRYTKDKFAGDLYLGGSYITGDNVVGYDIHLGNTAAYREKYWGAGGGLALTYNGQETMTGKEIFAPALGVKVPVEIVVGPKKYYGVAGVTPAWYFDEARKPDAGEVPFGDEFEWHIGAGVKIDQFKAQLGYSMVFTSEGQYSVPTISVGYNP